MFRPPTALVIDDSPIVRTVLSALLRRQGMTVATARDGEAGLAQATAEPPSLICLDLMLPNVSGLEVCRRLRRAPETAHVPVVIVSARPFPQDRAAALEAGADAFLQKPVVDEQFESTIRQVLWTSRDRRRAS
jgi:CheY-like chemotaxis protein